MDIQLFHQWNAKRDQLDFLIQSTELQLVNVNKRLKRLWCDLAYDIGMIVLPVLFLWLWPQSKGVGVISSIVTNVLRTLVVYACIFLWPFIIYSMIKTSVFLYRNRENTQVCEPTVKGGKSRVSEAGLPVRTYRHDYQKTETTYRVEQKKLLYMLNRYYWYKTELEELGKKLTDEDLPSITPEEFRTRMEKLVFYEEVKPAVLSTLWNRKYAAAAIVITLIIYVLVGLRLLIDMGSMTGLGTYYIHS